MTDETSLSNCCGNKYFLVSYVGSTPDNSRGILLTKTLFSSSNISRKECYTLNHYVSHNISILLLSNILNNYVSYTIYSQTYVKISKCSNFTE